MKRIGGIALLLLAAMSLVGCGAGTDAKASAAKPKPKEPTSLTVKGHLTLIDSAITRYEGACSGSGGFGDIAGGAEVVVRDGKGVKVGLGHLGTGKADGPVTCVFPFTVMDVPTGGGIYSVEVTHRGEISFKAADAETVALSLS